MQHVCCCCCFGCMLRYWLLLLGVYTLTPRSNGDSAEANVRTPRTTLALVATNVAPMLSETISLARLESLANPVVVATQDVFVNEYDEASFIIEQAQQKFALDPAQDVRFCFEKAKHDPQDPTIYQPIAPGAIIGSLKGYWASNCNPERLFTLPEDGKLPLYFTVGPASSTATAAAASCSAAAAKSAAGAASAPEQAAAPTKKSKGKQAEKPYMATFRHAFRENCVRAQDGTPYLSTDNLPNGKWCCSGSSRCEAAGSLSSRTPATWRHTIP